MDWSKTKTIFIIVFSILNVFLYSMYLNKDNEAKKVEILGETTIETQLKQDNITYGHLPVLNEKTSYLSGKVKVFNTEELKKLSNQSFVIESGSKLISTLGKPVKLRNMKDPLSFAEFIAANVYQGSSFVLWDVNEQKREATFFQKTNNRDIFYNEKATVKIFWNEENEVIRYEQSMFDEMEQLEQKEELITALQAIKALYTKGLLKPNSKITGMDIGYSTLVQLTETQVLAPTWYIQVVSADGKKEDYFVNAIEGKVIDILQKVSEAEKK